VNGILRSTAPEVRDAAAVKTKLRVDTTHRLFDVNSAGRTTPPPFVEREASPPTGNGTTSSHAMAARCAPIPLSTSHSAEHIFFVAFPPCLLTPTLLTFAMASWLAKLPTSDDLCKRSSGVFKQLGQYDHMCQLCSRSDRRPELLGNGDPNSSHQEREAHVNDPLHRKRAADLLQSEIR
jgi:hypothetical protein